ncbi:MAG TPA: hypothetical protein ENI12_05835 [Nitrospirae bacterium]|nr:hypothetical protein [Nitrospirota bacterium]
MGGFRDEWLGIFEKLPFPVTVHDNDYNIVQANKSAKKLYVLRGRGAWKCYKYICKLDHSPPDCVCGWGGRKMKTIRDHAGGLGTPARRVYIPRILENVLVGSINIVIPDDLASGSGGFPLRVFPVSTEVRTVASTAEYQSLMGETLSEREGEVMEWLKQGKSNWEMARLMEIAEDTVKYHIKNIMRKLNVVNRVQAVAKVMELEKHMALLEMETRMQEINHRVRNSLSTLASLVALKRSRMKSRGAEEALAEIECRFATIAELYSVLEMDVKGELVHAPVFFTQVVSLVRDGFTDNEGNVRMDVSSVDVELHPRVAFACGLIINELLSNCLKHAFPDGGGGRIDVCLESNDSKGLLLRVKDNGKGFKVQLDKSASSGLRIVDVLAKQLGGSMVISSGDQKGAEVRVQFPGSQGTARA